MQTIEDLPHGFDTDVEYQAYLLGQKHNEWSILSAIENWNGETNSTLHQLLSKKMEAENIKAQIEVFYKCLELTDTGIRNEVSTLEQRLREII